MNRGDQIRAWYPTLHAAWGLQHWWPAQSRFEVIAGAFLTQNTAWTNVERALRNLRRARLLSVAGVRRVPLAELEALVRPAGYFRQKAQRLKNFVRFLDQRYHGSLTRLFARPTAELRAELLALDGVGRETADSILLYAASHPVFVVDAYTRRVVHRHHLLPYDAEYDQIRDLFESALGHGSSFPAPRAAAPTAASRRERPETRNVLPHLPSRMSRGRRGDVAQRYNEMHGLLVNVGKFHCQKRAPQCAGCPLERFLPRGGPRPLPVIPPRALGGARRRSIMK